MLPAVVYGKSKETLPLQIGSKEFDKVFKQTGENTLVNLKIEGVGEKKVLIHDVAHHNMKNEPVHVDFYEVDLTRKIHAQIPVHLVGAAPAVKELGGILVRSLKEVEVEALPTDLPQYIEISIEGLKTFDDLLRVQDLSLGDKVKILENPEQVVVSIQEPRSEEELAELEKPTAEEEKAAVGGVTAMPEATEGEEKKEGEVEEKAEAPSKEKEAK